MQVDVSDVRLLRPSTRLVLAMNSMDVGRREGARGVIDTAARYTVARRAWDRAYRHICVDRGIGHAISVEPESEVYRFGNGGLLKSVERVTVSVVLADHPLLLSYSVVESPVSSVLMGRYVVEGVGRNIKGSSKNMEYNGRSQPMEDSVAGHYCVTLSSERYAGLLKLKNSPALQDRQWRRVRKGTFHQMRAGVERARIVAHHCIHPSRVRSRLRMTRTTPVDPLSRSVISRVKSRVKPLFVAWTISVDSTLPAVFAAGPEFVRWPADFGLSVTSRLLDSLMKSMRASRSVRWINLDTNTPVTRCPLPEPLPVMRRRSLQLLSRLRPFRKFLGFSAVWTFNSNSRMLQPTHHPEI